jgi:hypothetical protein
MEPDDYIEDHDDDIPDFRGPEEIEATELSHALGSLHLLGDDPFLRMQAFNLSLVDHFIMGLELQLHRALQRGGRTGRRHGVPVRADADVDLRGL